MLSGVPTTHLRVTTSSASTTASMFLLYTTTFPRVAQVIFFPKHISAKICLRWMQEQNDAKRTWSSAALQVRLCFSNHLNFTHNQDRLCLSDPGDMQRKIWNIYRKRHNSVEMEGEGGGKDVRGLSKIGLNTLEEEYFVLQPILVPL